MGWLKNFFEMPKQNNEDQQKNIPDSQKTLEELIPNYDSAKTIRDEESIELNDNYSLEEIYKMHNEYFDAGAIYDSIKGRVLNGEKITLPEKNFFLDKAKNHEEDFEIAAIIQLVDTKK